MHVAIGFVMLLGAMDARHEYAKSNERARWAELLAGMISKDSETTIRVEHAFNSIRPELDDLVKTEVALAIEARQGGNGEAGAVHESAGPQDNAQRRLP